ncbi:Dinucleotide-utilizing enzyme [Paraburkholderia piptadeniae]|uniref:Dinucleotide-utilizing enzyme n=1 Tax=Paraburkholderia piptadeniae TaxID=1701573 RepID=A0A1N7SR66_9BURK|nr:aspartate dehydrogenase domain-containing protein [Paraburkholderia piptadeniae]SIT49427.1 Dinucleotide-utilizing enzyme [Paraburkholderia piptadeniae]
MNVGIIGAGRLGQSLARSLIAAGHRVAFILSRDGSRAIALPAVCHLTCLEEADIKGVDLVVEAASPEAVRQHGATILQFCDLAVLSTTALADAPTERALAESAGQHRTRLTLLSGGIVGLDGLHAVGLELLHVEIVTTKTPSAWGIPNHEGPIVIFDGSTREACERFPRNVNVHASVAHASIGFDRCKSVLMSDPDASALTQCVTVKGEDFGWTISLHSQSIGGVTGSLTPRSLLGNVHRLLDEKQKAQR